MPFGVLSRLITERTRLVIFLALIPVIGGIALSGAFESGLRGLGYNVPGTESDDAALQVEQATGLIERDLLVISSDRERWPSPSFRAAYGAAIRLIHRVNPEIKVAGPKRGGEGAIAADRTAITAVLALGGNVADRQADALDIQRGLDGEFGDNFSAGVIGNSPALADLIEVENRELVTAEAVGLPIAMILLLIAFGTVVAAGLPLMIGFGGLLASIGVVAIAMTVIDFNAFAETFMVMFGLALGIDYSLLFVRRFREERERGGSDREIVERTLRTAGRTVVFSGAIFSASVFPVVITGLPFFSDTILAVIIVVASAVSLTLTLLPAVLIALGDRLDKLRVPGRLGFAAGRLEGQGGRWLRWSRFVMRRPLIAFMAGAALLVAAATPLAGVKTGIDLNARALANEPSGRALANLAELFPTPRSPRLTWLCMAGLATATRRSWRRSPRSARPGGSQRRQFRRLVPT